MKFATITIVLALVLCHSVNTLTRKPTCNRIAGAIAWTKTSSCQGILYSGWLILLQIKFGEEGEGAPFVSQSSVVQLLPRLAELNSEKKSLQKNKFFDIVIIMS